MTGAVKDYLTRIAASAVWQFSGKPEKNRKALYNGAHGLRILTFHGTPESQFPRFKRIINQVSKTHEFIDPDEVDGILSETLSADKFLLTFDDGYGSNFLAAKWLTSRGIKAIFFIVPSLIDRTLKEYADYHRKRGIAPYLEPNTNRGLTTAELREMIDDGHLIAAHNYAHRNLGPMRSEEDLAYEIGNSLDFVSNLTGKPCEDFAVAFGQPDDLSNEAAEMLAARCKRVYMCFRGLNVPGKTSAFLMRHDVRFTQPDIFHRVAMNCGVDHTVADRNVQMLERVGAWGR